MSTIFHINEKNEAVQLHEQRYENEDFFQQLIVRYPDILAGEQINPEAPRTWILISREMGVPGHEGGGDQWFLDHLFIDQDGTPTFVEVKRSTDTRIRREVVAQMLDYAANASVYWPVDRLRQAFEDHNDSPSDELHEKLGISPGEEDSFWSKVDTNLRLGKLRLLFVADEIPASLQRIIEFLNGQMTDTEVLGLEVKQYVSSNGQRTLVPKIIGKTTSAVQVKQKQQRFKWDEESFLDRVNGISGDAVALVCQNILTRFCDLGCRIYWGEGSKQAGFVPIYDGKRSHQLLAVYSYGSTTKVEIYFQHFKEPFHTEEQKKKLLQKFNMIHGVEIPDNAISRRPSLDCKLFLDKANFEKFLQIYFEILAEIKQYEKLD